MSKESFVNGKRRFAARLAAFAFDRIEERGLFAADIRAGAAPDFDVETEPASHHVIAEQPRRARRIDRVLEALRRQRIFSADVDEAELGPRGEGGDRHRLDDRERVVFHQDAVFERSRFRFVRVAHDIVRHRGRLCDRVEFSPGGKRRAAATQKLRRGDFANNARASKFEGALERAVTAVR